MKATRYLVLFIILIVGIVACGGNNQDQDLTVIPELSENQPVVARSTTGSFFSINEVGLGPDGFVALTNFTDVPASLAGLYLCQGTDCFALPPETVDPDRTVRIAVGDGSGYDDVVATRASIGPLRPSDGEVALFASADVNNSAELALYLQWGSTPHVNTGKAIEAGLWLEGSYAPSSGTATRLFKVQETGLWLYEDPSQE